MDVQGLFLAYFSALVALILPSWLHHISRKSQPIKRANMSKVQQFPGTALILLFNHQRKGTKSERWQFLRQFPPQQQGVIFGIFYVTFFPVHCAIVRCAYMCKTQHMCISKAIRSKIGGMNVDSDGT